jgi:hypothetical protein
LTGILLQQPLVQQLDANGNPVSAAAFYFYLTGTTTPATVYSDTDLTTPLSNPVVADSAGRLANVYLDPAVTYRVRVYTAVGGSLIRDIDPYSITSSASAVTYLSTATGAVSRTASSKLDDMLSAKDFGAVGNGSTDDTAALQAFVTACETLKKRGYIPGTASYYKVTSPITFSSTGGDIVGAGTDGTKIKASGNFAEVFLFEGSAAGKTISDVWIDTSGTTTRCMNFENGSQVLNFERVRFTGDLSGYLVHSQAAGYLDFSGCRWDCGSATTWGLVLDMYNQGTRVRGRCIFGGIGQSVKITQSGSGDRVEGTVLENIQTITTGEYAIVVGNSLLTQIIGCNIDQASLVCVLVEGGADFVQIENNWIGPSAASAGVCLQFQPDAGNGHIVMGNTIYGGNTGLAITADGSNRVEGVAIIGNTFNNQANNSVHDCRVIGNVDRGTPTFGSWITTAAFGAGSYKFIGNTWHTTAPTLFHTGSTYYFKGDSGIVADAYGQSTPGGSVTSLAISHGLFRTPNNIMITPYGNTGAFYTSLLGSSTFTANWATSSTPTIFWSASV